MDVGLIILSPQIWWVKDLCHCFTLHLRWPPSKMVLYDDKEKRGVLAGCWYRKHIHWPMFLVCDPPHNLFLPLPIKLQFLLIFWVFFVWDWILMGDQLAFVVFSWVTTMIHLSFSQFIGTIFVVRCRCRRPTIQRGQRWQVEIDDEITSDYV